MGTEEEFNQLIEMAKKIVIGYLKDESLTDAIAEFYWNLFNSLVKKGFSKEVAVDIVRNAKLDFIKSR